MNNIALVTVTWNHADSFDIEKTTLFKSFRRFNPHIKFHHFHFNRGLFHVLESEYHQRFDQQSDYILYKIHMLKQKLEEVDAQYIIFCDANDVVCLGNVDHLPQIFDLENDVIVGAEKNQWPVPERKLNWPGFIDYSGFDAENNFFVNSGMVLAKKQNFIAMLQSMEDNILSKNIKDFMNDQAIYTWHYTAKHTPLIKLDYNTEFTVNTFKRSTNEFTKNDEQRIVSNANGSKPCFVHDNGWNHGSPRFLNHFELRRAFSDTYPHLKNISAQRPINQTHQDYLFRLRDEFNFTPSVIYDVGACVLHWTTIAKEVWPNAQYFLFEAMEESEEIFLETNLPYEIGVFSDVDNKEVTFFKNVTFPGGNSYYMENPAHSCMAEALFANPSNQFVRKTITLDTAQAKRNFPLPDLLKIDVQGCEVDILKGCPNILKNVKHLIVELQHVEYNIGAQLCHESISVIESLGFKLVTPKFSLSSHADADYHFIKL
jgi:FkbM family methyltransferase